MTTTTTITNTTTGVEAEVLAVLTERAAAHAARDADRIMACSIDAEVRYTLAPPLQQAPGTTDSAARVRDWLATFEGPVQINHANPVVTADGDVAFVHALTQLTAIPVGAPEPFSFWYRSTFGLRRINGQWRIVHEHESTPFHMDGSFRAATDLQP